MGKVFYTNENLILPSFYHLLQLIPDAKVANYQKGVWGVGFNQLMCIWHGKMQLVAAGVGARRQ